jgi:hypothetical protein
MAPERPPLQIQSGNNAPELSRAQSYAVSATLDGMCLSSTNRDIRIDRDAKQKPGAGTPGRAQLLSFDFLNALICSDGSSMRMTSGAYLQG